MPLGPRMLHIQLKFYDKKNADWVNDAKFKAEQLVAGHIKRYKYSVFREVVNVSDIANSAKHFKKLML